MIAVITLGHLKGGYAQLLDADVALFSQPGLHTVVTARRDRPGWANWVHPIWLLAIDDTIICSVSPAYATSVQQVITGCAINSLLAPELLERLSPITVASAEPVPEWVQRELFWYPHIEPPRVQPGYTVKPLQPVDEKSRYLLRNFDGGGFVIRDESGAIAAHACIKNKGVLKEVAVGTEPAFRQRGMGKAVATAAVDPIVRGGYVPVYCPDSVENIPSYRLAASLGFEKVAEMLFCAYALPQWAGFPIDEATDA